MKHKIKNFCLSVFLCLALSSCVTAALAGLVGGGTYYLGKSVAGREDKKIKTESLVKIKEEMEQKQKALSSKDKGITNEINQRLVSGSVTEGMAIYPEVRNGVVILHGRVPDPKTAERVISAARTTPGVSRIISNLVVVSQQQPIPQGYADFQRGAAQGGAQRVSPNQYIRQQNQTAPGQVAPIPIQQQRYAPQPVNQQYIPPQTNNFNSGNFGSKKKSGNLDIIEQPRRPANDAKVMSESMMQQYSDNDDNYKKYVPPQINNNGGGYQSATPVFSNPYIVNVPTPTIYRDNDASYIPTTSYVVPATSNYDSEGSLNIDIPVPSPYQDNDATYELMHYY